ncbi:MAG: hypothetical protein GOU97_04555 [Nanoarchaeota archaeon]|nr:hypothetical protein [Nanoarchaeota archaeon]
MGFFDFFSKSKEPEKLGLEEALNFFSQKLEKASSIDFVNPKKLEKKFLELLKLLESFKQSEPRDEINPYLLNKVLSSRKSFIIRMRTFAVKAKDFAHTDFEEVEDSIQRVMDFLKTASKLGADYSDKLSIAFKKEIAEIGKKLEGISKEFTEIKKEMDERNEVRQGFKNRIRKLERIKKLEEMISSTLAEDEKAKKEVAELEEQLGSRKQEVEKFEESAGLKQLESLENQLVDINDKIDTLKSVVTAKLSESGKALKKYANLRPGDKELTLFLEDPFSIIDSAKIMVWLNEARSLVEKEAIQLKPKQKIKSLKSLSAIDRSYFDKAHLNLAELLLQKKTIENIIDSSDLHSELDELKKSILFFENNLKIKKEVFPKNQEIRKVAEEELGDEKRKVDKLLSEHFLVLEDI